MKAALRVLQANGITVSGSWFDNADVVLTVDEQDVQKARAALAKAGFVVATAQNGR
ncbi:MAG: hypothetical protein JO121_26920 [Deltaproteobacteria bacterium]|nr:hypothetical protein [Deltaproteobacteria bacterium]